MEIGNDMKVEELSAEKLLAMTDLQRKTIYDGFAEFYSTSMANSINRINKTDSLYNPILSNSLLKNAYGLSKPPTQKDLERWLANPTNYSKQLRGVSNYFNDSIMQYKRTTNHFKKLMTFRYDLRLGSEFKQEEAKTILNSRGRIMEFLMNFNVGYHSTVVTDRVIDNGGAFFYLSKNKDFNTLIELPIDYCYITGKWDRGFTFALDLAWFDEIDGMENQLPEIYNYYKDFVAMRKVGITDSTLSKMQYYPIPIEQGYVFTFDTNDMNIIPPLAGIFKDANSIFTYKNLLMQKTSLDTWKIIGQKIPLHKETQMPLFSPQQAQIFVDFVQSVLPEGTAVFATPMEFEAVDMSGKTSQDNIVGRGEEVFWRSVGVNGTMMDAGDKSAGTLKYSLENDFGFVDNLYTQFENFLNLQIQIISRQHRFFIKFYGNKYSEKEDLLAYKDLVSTVNAPVGKMYGLMGYEPFEVLPTIELENYLKIKEKSLPIIAGSQQSGDIEKGGAPTKKDSDLTTSGANTKNTDGNFKGGKTSEV